MPLKANISSTWKDISRVYVNIGGTWKQGSVFVNVGGAWKSTGGFLFIDNCSSLSGWTVGGQGTAATDGNSFYASSYGSGSDWHGPTLTRNLGFGIANFECEVDLTINNTGDSGYIGNLVVRLLDESNNVIGQVGISDAWAANMYTHLGADAGVVPIYASGMGTEFNDYSGTMKITRSGSTWRFYTGATLRGTLDGGPTTLITQIQLIFRAAGSFPPCPILKINNISITG